MYENDLAIPLTPFQDPYSDVSLFLSKKIKLLGSSDTEWSHQLQDELLQKITPEFVKKFPDHRLGASTLKKTWEKVAHLSKLLHQQNEALTSGGKLNLHFLIRENLKTVASGTFHPFLLAQQLALKIGEALATYEGTKPEIEHLTEIIWTALHHIVAPVHLPTTRTKKNIDVKDRLLTKWMVDILTLQPAISYHDLSKSLHEKLHLFQTLKLDLTPLYNELSMNWSTALLPHTQLLQNESSTTIQNLRKWIQSKLDSCSLVEIKNEALASKKSVSLNDLEILFWNVFRELSSPLVRAPVYEELEQEAKFHLIHHPQEHWKSAINHAIHYMQKAHEISKLTTKAEWSKRIENWALQGELVLRTLDLPKTPLLHYVYAMHAKNRSLSDPALTAQLREQYLYRYRSPLLEPSFVHKVADLTRKYGWYHIASTPKDVTIQRWSEFHTDMKSDPLSQFPILPFLPRKNKYTPIRMNGTESH